MSATLSLLQDLGNKVRCKEQYECRTLQINMPAPETVDIEFIDITMKASTGFIKRNTKTILNNVSGHFKSGELTAIMGPSGAGKTSLLNALTGFSIKGVKGKIRAGDSVCDLDSTPSLQNIYAYRKKSCYILQDDRLNPLFTVSELMQFAADLKIGNTLTQKMKHSVISEVMNALGLIGIENTRCCNLSGGQRKRLSIAVELIDNPPVLFLDEPTTGLDSMTSWQCMQMLRNVSRTGRTIIFTIHQPPASIYKMFDQVYVLAEGRCVYRGPSSSTVPHLASLGLTCPKNYNPADYILEIANGEYGKLNDLLAANHTAFKVTDKVSTLPCEESPKISCDKMTLVINRPHEFYKFGVLLKSCIILQYRDWTITHLRIALHILIGILLGLLFNNGGNDASKTVSNLGFLIVSPTYLCYTSLMPAVLRFPDLIPVLKKENFNNWYNLKTYYAASLVTSIPIQICYSIVYLTPAYLLTGQPLVLYRFGMFTLVLALVTLVADALGNFIGSCVNPINGTFLGAVTTCTLIVFAGFLVIPTHMLAALRPLVHASFLKQGFEALALAVYGWDRLPLNCPETKNYCHLRYPKQILQVIDITADHYWQDIGILCAEIVLFRIIAFYALRWRMKKFN